MHQKKSKAAKNSRKTRTDDERTEISQLTLPHTRTAMRKKQNKKFQKEVHCTDNCIIIAI